MRISIAQLNPLVGDVAGNAQRIKDTVQRCASDNPDLVVFPELFLVGYPPRDLLERAWFIERVLAAVKDLEAFSTGYPDMGILFGAPLPSTLATGKGLSNVAVLLHGGRTVAKAVKALLPTYDVFDEERYFDPAESVQVTPFKGQRLGIHICEDAWTNTSLWSRKRPYALDPIAALANQGATLLLNISASPFNVGKEIVRYRLLSGHARERGIPFVYVNQIGGNDELLFDGRSLCVDRQGNPLAVLPAFEEHVETMDVFAQAATDVYRPQEEIASVHDALVMGLRDYMHKCGFSKAVLGLSGGIDSAVTACLAAEALGAQNVLGITMPSPFSSQGSIEDSRQLAHNLGIGFRIAPISDIYHSYLESLREPFAGTQPSEAEENIQARIRGNILMAMSNKFGYLLLSTGNKSELAVGYCTLYGDMSGGLAVISDVPKTMIYKLAHYINREREIIPQASIDKPPSAELKPDQVDQDTLPPYPILDQILAHYVEEGLSVEEIIAQGFDAPTVQWVARTVNRNEYKRRQAAPGLRVTTKAFGIGRRMPIAARF
jgi:NAD+ synthase (glutamine-hydrolysing)